MTARETARSRRSFIPEFKADIVARCEARDRTVGKQFDLTETAVREWVRRAQSIVGTEKD